MGTTYDPWVTRDKITTPRLNNIARTGYFRCTSDDRPPDPDPDMTGWETDTGQEIQYNGGRWIYTAWKNYTTTSILDGTLPTDVFTVPPVVWDYTDLVTVNNAFGQITNTWPVGFFHALMNYNITLGDDNASVISVVPIAGSTNVLGYTMTAYCTSGSPPFGVDFVPMGQQVRVNIHVYGC